MLETFNNLQLSGFASLFEIAVTLNLVYVVAEKAKQYGSTLTKNFFQSGSNIEKRFVNRFSLIDKESVETMPAITINQRSTEGEIQEAKREIHKLEDSKEKRIENLNRQTDSRCVLTSFSFISLYMFFYSLMSLFVGGLNITPFVKAYFSTFTLLSIIILSFVTIYGEKTIPNKMSQDFSLTNCCWTFLIVAVLSLVSLLYRMQLDCYSSIYWPLFILLSVILPYTAFVIFMIIIHKRLLSLSSELNKEIAEFDDECRKVEGHIHQLKEVYELSINMESNQNNTAQNKAQNEIVDNIKI